MQHGPFIGQGGYEILPSTLQENHSLIVRKSNSEVAFIREYSTLTVWAGATDHPQDGSEHRIQLPVDNSNDGEYDAFFQFLLQANEGDDLPVQVFHRRPGHDDETVYEF